MTALAPIARPQRLVATSCAAFHLRADGSMFPCRGDTGAPIAAATGEDLDAVVAEMSRQCTHKAQFAVRETNEFTGAAVLHVYRIKQQSKPVYAGAFGHQRVQPMYAEKVAVVQLPGVWA